MIGKSTFNFRISINWLWLIIALGLISVVAYISHPPWQSDLAYAIAVLGGVGVLISAINDIDVRREALRQGRLKNALDFVHEWNNPLFFHAKNHGRQVLRKFKEKDDTVDQFLKEKPDYLGNLIDIMNFLELLSVSVQIEESDEAAAKRFFRGIMLEY